MTGLFLLFVVSTVLVVFVVVDAFLSGFSPCSFVVTLFACGALRWAFRPRFTRISTEFPPRRP
jgi:peptidoglycan biosynthesis protein MviN/MurJ (putative lipid II flippase)